MSMVGPGAVQQNEIAPDAKLQGASSYEFASIYNPLTDDFVVQVAQSRPVDLPFKTSQDTSSRGVTSSESDVRQVYGLAMKNPDHVGRKHITNQIILKAGTTTNMGGDAAQVAVKQLVDYIMQKEGRTKFMTDPVARREVEDTIVKRRGSMEELMGGLDTVQSQIDTALTKSNEVRDEKAFPTITTAAETGDSKTATDEEVSTDQPVKRTK